MPARKGVAETDTELKVVAGQTIYVPVYSQVPVGDKGHPFALSVTLSIRNTDRSGPIVIRSVNYFDQDGRLIRSFLKRPVRVSPMASVDYFVEERDLSGGISASFLVEWVAEQPVSNPLTEAVMVGTASSLGVSFTSRGSIVAEKAKQEPSH